MKYTINELSQEIKRSRPVTEKWVNRKGYEATTKLVNNREVKAFILDYEQLEELKHALEGEQEENIIEGEYIPHSEPTAKVPEMPANFIEIANLINNIHEKNNERLEAHRERTAFAEAQLKLIETSETRKDNEIHRLQAELKQALSQVEQLTKENAQLKQQKTFFGFKIGK